MATLFASLAIGSLITEDVTAVIQTGLGEQVLLGMSFLERVAFSQQGERLVFDARE